MRGIPPLVLLVMTLGGLAAGCAPSASLSAPPTPQATSPPLTPQPTLTEAVQSAAPFDQQLIDMMVPHHEGAVEMAKIAERRAQRLEIKALAADILRTRSAEIAQMKAWREAWFGSHETPPMSRMPLVEGMQMPAGAGHAGHEGNAGPLQAMDMAAAVEVLREAPEPFDVAFIDAMIPHHQIAVEAARAALQRASRPEFKDLAVQMIDTQLREIGLMREWRLKWPASGAAVETGPGERPTPEPGEGKDPHAGH
jgi:uncharacterized protein (DUF305 family)